MNRLHFYRDEGWFWLGWGEKIPSLGLHLHIKKCVGWKPWWRIFQVPFTLLHRFVANGAIFYGPVIETAAIKNGHCSCLEKK